MLYPAQTPAALESGQKLKAWLFCLPALPEPTATKPTFWLVRTKPLPAPRAGLLPPARKQFNKRPPKMKPDSNTDSLRALAWETGCSWGSAPGRPARRSPGRDACPRVGAAGPGPAEGARAAGTSPQPGEGRSLGRGESPKPGQAWSLSNPATYLGVAEPEVGAGSVFAALPMRLAHAVW